jgi:hypothetical protein
MVRNHPAKKRIEAIEKRLETGIVELIEIRYDDLIRAPGARLHFESNPLETEVVISRRRTMPCLDGRSGREVRQQLLQEAEFAEQS